MIKTFRKLWNKLTRQKRSYYRARPAALSPEALVYEAKCTLAASRAWNDLAISGPLGANIAVKILDDFCPPMRRAFQDAVAGRPKHGAVSLEKYVATQDVWASASKDPLFARAHRAAGDVAGAVQRRLYNWTVCPS